MHSLGSAVAAIGVSRVRGNVTMLDVGVIGHRHACKKISKISVLNMQEISKKIRINYPLKCLKKFAYTDVHTHYY